jgi:hypothetical protein
MNPAETLLFTQLVMADTKGVDFSDAHDAAMDNSENYAKIHHAIPNATVVLKLWLAGISNGDVEKAKYLITTVGEETSVLQWVTKYGGRIPCGE